MLKIIKTQLKGAKGIWPDELPDVLWAYRTTCKKLTKKTPFNLVYDQQEVVPMEYIVHSLRIATYIDMDESGVF